MRDVIQKVIKAEAEAKCMVESARAEADRILSDARKKGLELQVESRGEARVEAEQMLKAAAEEAGQEKRKLLAEAAARIDAEVRLEEAAMQRAAEAACRCVCGFR